MRTQHTDTVDVFLIRLDEPPAPVRLDDEEQQRAARFKFDRDRRRFIAAHAATRVVLGRALGIDPAAVTFAVGPRGKPHLIDAPVDVRFNLSHSGERALLAVALGREVGVDIEQWRILDDLFALAERVFSSAEIATLRQTPDDRRHEVFFRVWSRKESFIKARGDGVYFALAGFDVSTEADGPQLLLACSASPADMQRWTTRALPSEPGYSAALTVEGGPFEVRMTQELYT